MNMIRVTLFSTELIETADISRQYTPFSIFGASQNLSRV